jgi:hypothetical protein
MKLRARLIFSLCDPSFETALPRLLRMRFSNFRFTFQIACSPHKRMRYAGLPGKTRMSLRSSGLGSRTWGLVLATACARALQKSSAQEVRGRSATLEDEGAGNAGCPMHPWFGQKMPGSCHRFTGFNRHSLRNGFTAYFVLSPATGLCCHRHSSEALAPQALDASNGASGPHDFAVRDRIVRPRAKNARRRHRDHRIPSHAK